MANASQIEEIKKTLQRGLDNLVLSNNLKPLPLRQQVERPSLKSSSDVRRYSDSFPRRQSPASSKPGTGPISQQRSNSMLNVSAGALRRRPLSAKGVEIPRPNRTPNRTLNNNFANGALMRTPPSRKGRLGSEGSSMVSTPTSGRPLAAKSINRMQPSPPVSPNKSKGGVYVQHQQNGAMPKTLGKRLNGDGMVTMVTKEYNDDGEEWSDIDETEEDSLNTPRW